MKTDPIYYIEQPGIDILNSNLKNNLPSYIAGKSSELLAPINTHISSIDNISSGEEFEFSLPTEAADGKSFDAINCLKIYKYLHSISPLQHSGAYPGIWTYYAHKFGKYIEFGNSQSTMSQIRRGYFFDEHSHLKTIRDHKIYSKWALAVIINSAVSSENDDHFSLEEALNIIFLLTSTSIERLLNFPNIYGNGKIVLSILKAIKYYDGEKRLEDIVSEQIFAGRHSSGQPYRYNGLLRELRAILSLRYIIGDAVDQGDLDKLVIDILEDSIEYHKNYIK